MIHSQLPRTHAGFTLVELMITLAIAVILLGLAIPSFVSFIEQIRLSTVVSELHSAITLTRSEALKRNGKVDLVAINGDWINGWVIKNPDDEEIISHEALRGKFNISGKFSDGQQHIAYNGAGRSRGNTNTNVSQFGHIQISLGEHSRLIVVNFLGRVRVCNPATDKNCMTTEDD